MQKFRKVGLVARMDSPLVLESLKRVEVFLRSQSVDVVLEDLARDVLKGTDLAFCSQEEMGSRCDLVIAVGGDGNILGAARTLAPYGVPLLGINRGRLGFLADVSPDEIELRIGEVLAGHYSMEEHFLLEGEVGEKHQITSALNEVVLHSASMAKMIEFDLYVNDDFVYKQNSDGLIVSTPTGSTAYALSAGGPIMHPSLDAMVLIPMFPHTLNSRPLVVRGDSELKIVVSPELDGFARVSFDSHQEFEVQPGESIVIRKNQHKLKLIHPPGHSFYSVCRSKLDWASRVGD